MTSIDWQSWVVILLLLFCSVRISISIYSFFRNSNKRDNPCAHCTSTCNLKRKPDKKHKDLCPLTKKRRKSCCG